MIVFWDWVGARYSTDSEIGISTMITLGAEDFRTMHDSIHQMDAYFRTDPFQRNVPVRMELLGLWHNNFFGAKTMAV